MTVFGSIVEFPTVTFAFSSVFTFTYQNASFLYAAEFNMLFKI